MWHALTQVIAELLSGDEVETIKTMFMTMDTQKRGYLSFDEFLMGLRKFGSQLTDTEIQHLMEDVRIECAPLPSFLHTQSSSQQSPNPNMTIIIGTPPTHSCLFVLCVCAWKYMLVCVVCVCVCVCVHENTCSLTMFNIGR